MDFSPQGGDLLSEQVSNPFYINTNICSDEHQKTIHFIHNTIHYVVEGQGFLKIKDHLFTISAGQTFFIPRDCYASHWSDGGYKYIWIQFGKWEMFDQILSKLAFSVDAPLCPTTDEQAELFDRIRRTKYNIDHDGQYWTMGLLLLLLSSYIKTNRSQSQLMPSPSIKSILAYIDSNLHRTDLSVATLSQISHISPSVLHKRFKEELDYPPGAYIRRKRISRAAHLLLRTMLPINEIAKSVGFEDPLYFSRLFHKTTKCSPTRFRRLYSELHTANNKK